jgi:hypothetical protein
MRTFIVTTQYGDQYKVEADTALKALQSLVGDETLIVFNKASLKDLTIDWVIHRRANSALTVTTKVLKPIEGDNK